MPENKRYYWIKLKANFFDIDEIDWLISQENGCEYIVLYQKLCLMTANKGGALATTVGEMIIPFDAKKIARDTKFPIDTVVVALELFKNLGLVYEQDDGILKIPAVSDMVGSEVSSAKRVREHRQKKALQCNTDVTQEKEYRDKSIDKDIKKEKDYCHRRRQRAREEIRRAYGKFFGSVPDEFEVENVLRYMISLHKPADEFSCSEDDLELLDIAFENAVKSGKKNIAYIEGIYCNLRKKGIKTSEDYWENEADRDMKAGRI